jgi:hypothetical protein
MNKLMMTVGSLALMAIASPVLAQSSSNGPASAPPTATAPSATPAPGVTAPNNSSTNMPMDMAPSAPMSSKGSTSAVSPKQSDPDMSADSDSQKPMKMSHKMHHQKQMGSSKASGSKSTDHDADQLNQQELGKLRSPS